MPEVRDRLPGVSVGALSVEVSFLPLRLHGHNGNGHAQVESRCRQVGESGLAF